MACKLLIILGFIISFQAHSETNLENLIQVRSADEWKVVDKTSVKKEKTPTLRCKEELSLGLVPITCFETSILTPDTSAFLDRQCHYAVESIQSLRVLGSLLSNTNLSQFCRDKIKERGRVVAYKLEDQRPAEAFEFFGRNLGTNLVNQIGHAQRTAN